MSRGARRLLAVAVLVLSGCGAEEPPTGGPPGVDGGAAAGVEPLRAPGRPVPAEPGSDAALPTAKVPLPEDARVRPYAERLRSLDPRVRAEAAYALFELGPAAAGAAADLEAATLDPDTKVRYLAISALRRIREGR